MSLDLDAIADRMYPTAAPNTPVVPPVEAKTTPEPAATTPAEPRAADTATHTTTDQTNTPDPDAPYTLTLPEDAVLDAGAVERVTAFAKANYLDHDTAQQALNHANAEVAADRAQLTDAWDTLTRETWVTESKNDPEIGGEKFTGAVTDAKRFLEKFGDDEVLKFLADTGFGNNKFVIRLLARAENGRTNHRRLTGGGSGGGARDTTREGIAKRLYSKHT